MDEQERIEGEDVEAHRRKAKLMASEEAPDEAEAEDDDVEAHSLRHRPQSL